ncbi:MAG TPA: cobalamin biosynthesis protein, partial [Tahibacter sp.]|nr:cobalamin biosynthesis protein [Tahibacter sp.]
MIGAGIALTAFALDHVYGEPSSQRHPLVAFGRYAAWIERQRYRPDRTSGIVALALAVAPIVAAAWLLTRSDLFGALIAALLL